MATPVEYVDIIFKKRSNVYPEGDIFLQEKCMQDTKSQVSADQWTVIRSYIEAGYFVTKYVVRTGFETINGVKHYYATATSSLYKIT